MVQVCSNDAVRIGKSILGFDKGDAMLSLVFQVLIRIPLAFDMSSVYHKKEKNILLYGF
jgi:hypothetical protein